MFFFYFLINFEKIFLNVIKTLLLLFIILSKNLH